QRKGHLEAAESNALDHFLQTIEFSFFSAQKFTAGRSVEEEITHFDRCPLGMSCWIEYRLHLLPLCRHPPGGLVIGSKRTRGEFETRNGTDAGKCFTAKAETENI